jgi:predicted methyltransferase
VPGPAASLAEQLMSRSEEDRARDEARKPAEVIAFLGIESGMTVLDLLAAGGWYTEVLATAVGPDGKVYAQNTPFLLEMREGANEKAMTARLADNRLPNVERLDRELDDLGLEHGRVDAAMFALNLHDVYNRGGAEAALGVLAVIYEALKPGGIVAIIDHDGGADADNANLHRIERAKVIEVVETSDFELEAESGVLHHHEDDLSAMVFAPEIRGKTDRFVLRLKKPI